MSDLPDFDSNPAGHVLARVSQLEQAYSATAQENSRLLAERIANDEKAIARDRPDYHDALKHALGVEESRLLASGLDERRAKQEAARSLTKRALTQGGNVAEAVIELAESNGYTAKHEAPENEVTRILREVNGGR